MTIEDFDQFQSKLFDDCRLMGYTKGKEYADADDRFANFNEEAKENDVDRLLVAMIFMNKHMRAIRSYIKNGKVYSEPIRGRFIDLIVYATLILGMIEEDQIKAASKCNVTRAVKKS